MKKCIYIATHVPFIPPKSKLYKPIQVGSMIYPDLPYLKDSNGQNISNKNPYYCELTALYWMWKNSEEDVVGLAHYRRYFTKILDSISPNLSLNMIYRDNCIILPKLLDFGTYTVKEQYTLCHHYQDYEICEKIVQKLYPKYQDSFKSISNQNKLYCWNMFIMHRGLLNDYCNWLFPILETLEELIEYKQYDSYNKRVFGFLAERLFNVWIHHQKKEILELDVSHIDSVQKTLK